LFSSRSRRLADIATSIPPARTAVLIRRAIVLGGGIAGLLAARVLSDHADEVLVVERDESDGPHPRPGVPQGTQVHALLKGGEIQLARWFPGFVEEAVALGMVMPTPDDHMYAHFNGVDLPFAMVPTLLATRPVLESLVRARTLAVDNIRLVAGRAAGVDLDGDHVVGARYVPPGATDAVTERADFVADAMGRSSRLTDWLADAGWPRPELTRMQIKLNYATCLFERDDRISDLMLVLAQTLVGGRPRGAVVNRVEGDRWILMAAGYDQDHPGRTVQELAAFCRESFPAVFADVATQARPVGEVVTYRQADSRRREFHALDRFPAGLAAAGDAVASFNPIYGQGMTSAMLHASCLSAYLRAVTSLDQPAKAYFELVRVVGGAAGGAGSVGGRAEPPRGGPGSNGVPVA
jgi:2-polyprenyl-6-methoxyphenol hydroxylase-like FAD-dependent oxidoreductase